MSDGQLFFCFFEVDLTYFFCDFAASSDGRCDLWPLAGRGFTEIRLETLVYSSPSSLHHTTPRHFVMNPETIKSRSMHLRLPWASSSVAPGPKPLAQFWLAYFSRINRRRQTIGQSPGIWLKTVNRSAGRRTRSSAWKWDWLTILRRESTDIRLTQMPVQCPSFCAIIWDKDFGMRLFGQKIPGDGWSSLRWSKTPRLQVIFPSIKLYISCKYGKPRTGVRKWSHRPELLPIQSSKINFLRMI